jgi:hypothetical protein
MAFYGRAFLAARRTLSFMAFYGRAFLAARRTLSLMAFYGRLFLEALFLLWLFMDDSFLKHSFFYGFLWTTLS